MRIEQLHIAAYSALSGVHVATGVAHSSPADFAIAALYAAIGPGSWIVGKVRRPRTKPPQDGGLD